MRVLAIVMAFALSGCVALDIRDAVKEEIKKSAAQTRQELAKPEVKERIIAVARVKLENKLDEAKVETLRIYDEKAPEVYDAMVDSMLNPGVLGIVAGAIGIALRILFGSGLLVGV